MYDLNPDQSKKGRGQQDGSSVRTQGQNHDNQQSKWVSKPEPRHRYRVSSNSESPNPNVDDVRGNLSSSSLVEEPARALVRAFGRTLLGLHPVGQPSESRHAGSLTGSAGVGSTAATKRLSDTTEWVVGEVGLGGSSAAETASGALFGGFEAFFDGEELGFESGRGVLVTWFLKRGFLAREHTCD